MDALQFLAPKAKIKPQPLTAVFGDEDFLKRQARDKLLKLILDDADPELALAVYAGDSLEFSRLRSEVETLPLFSPCRIVIVEQADEFVSENRQALEEYAGKPSSVGFVILECKTFTETTRLAKMLSDEAKIACKSPWADRLPGWSIAWAKSRYQKVLMQDAAELLVERVGKSMGLLDQELAKLAMACPQQIQAEDVNRLVGRSKEANVFQILDAIGNGNTTDALSLLEELFADGVDPMAALAAITFQIRKLATVARLTAAGMQLGPAMDAAQVKTWGDTRKNFEKQLRHLGRRRLEKLSEWLAEMNIGLKGGNALPERVQVERFIVLLARPREEVK